MLTHIDHVGIACRDLEEKISFYCATFGLTVASREVNEEQGVREAMLLVATASPEAVGVPDLRAAGAAAGSPGTDLRGAAGAAAGSPGARVLPLLASYIQLLEPLRPDSWSSHRSLFWLLAQSAPKRAGRAKRTTTRV